MVFCVMSWVMLLSKKRGVIREIEKEMRSAFVQQNDEVSEY